MNNFFVIFLLALTPLSSLFLKARFLFYSFYIYFNMLFNMQLIIFKFKSGDINCFGCMLAWEQSTVDFSITMFVYYFPHNLDNFYTSIRTLVITLLFFSKITRSGDQNGGNRSERYTFDYCILLVLFQLQSSRRLYQPKNAYTKSITYFFDVHNHNQLNA